MTAMYPSTGSRLNHAFISTAYPECQRVARPVVGAQTAIAEDDLAAEFTDVPASAPTATIVSALPCKTRVSANRSRRWRDSDTGAWGRRAMVVGPNPWGT